MLWISVTLNAFQFGCLALLLLLRIRAIIAIYLWMVLITWKRHLSQLFKSFEKIIKFWKSFAFCPFCVSKFYHFGIDLLHFFNLDCDKTALMMWIKLFSMDIL